MDKRIAPDLIDTAIDLSETLYNLSRTHQTALTEDTGPYLIANAITLASKSHDERQKELVKQTKRIADALEQFLSLAEKNNL